MTQNTNPFGGGSYDSQEFRDAVGKVVADRTGFTDRKLTDTPTDAFQAVPRRYVNLNGPTTTRPTSSVIGQFYLDTTLAAGRGKPIWYGPSGWVDATGTLI